MGRQKSRASAEVVCNLKDYRQKKGWSQESLAELLGLRRQAVYDIESGRYLPNTAVALKLARLFGCRVEDLFVEEDREAEAPVHVVDGEGPPSTRLALSRVRDRLIGLPLRGPESISFGLRSADGLLNPDRKSARLLSSPDQMDRSIILMGCDPAFEILAAHVARAAPGARVHCRFASSHRALAELADGTAHLAGTHLHNSGREESNVALVKGKLGGATCRVLGFSVMEEGLMVAEGNPLGIKSAADLARPGLRLVNREPGAALRTLLDDHLARAGIPPEAVEGYGDEVRSHREGAYRIACRAADAALGLRIIAEAYHLGFVPLAAVRCDLVVPADMIDHPTIGILLDVLQSKYLRQELESVPGYDSSATGKTIAEV